MFSKITDRQVLNSSSSGIVVTDGAGKIVDINRKAEKILDLNPACDLGAYVVDKLPLTGPRVMSCLESGECVSGHPIIAKKANLVLNINLIREGAEILGAICEYQELGQFENAKRKLETLRRMNLQLEAIFNASSDGLWVCDSEGTVISINEASERLSGVRKRDVTGKNMADLVAGGLADRSVTLEVLRTRRQVTVMQHIKKTGCDLLTTGTPVFDESGEIHLIVVNERDITELNAIREELDQKSMVTEKIRDELVELSMLELNSQEIVAESAAMKQVLYACLKVARIEATNVLILGESGTGKGLMAKFIHKNSPRGGQPFVQINCAAVPEGLLEAELFGYERGAFTGASEQGKAGLFELANGGTLFLDEIGDMPPPLQAKLLKYLDDHEVMRVGGVKKREIDCMVIAATNQNLEKLCGTLKFRRDLFYRLDTFTIRIPPLRERPEDVFELTSQFLRRYNRRYGVNKRISTKGMNHLQSHLFPGNVRELKSIVKKGVVMSDEAALDDYLQDCIRSKSVGPDRFTLQGRRVNLNEELFEVERRILVEVAGRCRTTRELASELGVSQSTAVRRLKQHGLEGRLSQK